MNSEDFEYLPSKEQARISRRNKKFAAASRAPMNSGQNKYWHSVAQSLERKADKKNLSKNRKNTRSNLRPD